MARQLPASVEAEKCLLGSMLISPRDVIGECAEKINGDYFYTPAHQTIYSVLLELWRAQEGIDLITFTNVLRKKKVLDKVGGASFVTSLFTFVPTASNWQYYLAIIQDKYLLREMIAAGTELVARAFDDQGEAVDLLGQFEREALSIRPSNGSKQMPSVKDLVMDAVESIERRSLSGTEITGIATGFADFDRLKGGLQGGEFILIAARPSMGKTAFCMNVAEHVAIQLKKRVGVFSLEMSASELMHRLLCSRAGVNTERINNGMMVAERDWPKLTAAASRIAESNLFIDDSSDLKLDGLAAKMRRMKVEKEIDLAVVDYLQLLSAFGFKPNERQAEVTFISKGIKSLAKDLGIPIIVAAQLNRNPETRADGRPRLSDLRESGSLEQDADVVAFIHRPAVYARDEEEKMELEGRADLIVAKHRNGATGEVPLTWRAEFTRFEDRAREERH